MHYAGLVESKKRTLCTMQVWWNPRKALYALCSPRKALYALVQPQKKIRRRLGKSMTLRAAASGRPEPVASSTFCTRSILDG